MIFLEIYHEIIFKVIYSL